MPPIFLLPLLLLLLLGDSARAYVCPSSSSSAACVRDAHCQWDSSSNRCVNSLPCALEPNSTACGESARACHWNSVFQSCSSVAAHSASSPFATQNLACTALSTGTSCTANKACHIDTVSLTCKRRPTIVLSMADDLGNYDVGWNNPRARTPVLDALRNQGVAIDRHYTDRFCAPSRGMLLTGVFAWKMGLQSDANLNPAYALRCSTTRAATANGKRNVHLLPELLRERGAYETHMFGKWHLGSARVQDLPTTVGGFDTFMGFYGGGIGNQRPSTTTSKNRFTSKQCACHPAKRERLAGRGACKALSASTWQYCATVMALVNDTRATHEHRVLDATADYLRGEDGVDSFLAKQAAGKLTDPSKANSPLFIYLAWTAPHNPVYAPDRYKQRILQSRKKFGTDALINRYCSAAKRVEHLAMITMMDDAHGVVIDALDRSNRWLDSVFVFLSDNGGNGPGYTTQLKPQKCSYGYNYPLRGGKFTWWEGGVRNVAFAVTHSAVSTPLQRTFTGLMSIADWKSTLLDAAGVQPSKEKEEEDDDSVSRWAELTGNEKEDSVAPRTELALQVWLEQNRFVILFQHDDGEWWKVIQGYPWSGTGSGTVGRGNAAHALSYLLQPPELPRAEITVAADTGKGKVCRKSLCLYNVSQDPAEKRNLGSSSKTAARKRALELIAKYKKRGELVNKSGLCFASEWYATSELAVTDKHSMVLARKCGGFTAWLSSDTTTRTQCTTYE